MTTVFGFTVIVTCNSLKNRVVAVPSHSVRRRHPNHVNPAEYPFRRDREARRFQALDAMLDWLEHFASISCITPRDNGGCFVRSKAQNQGQKYTEITQGALPWPSENIRTFFLWQM